MQRSTALTQSLIPDNISPLSAQASPSSFPFCFPFFSSSVVWPKHFSHLPFLINHSGVRCQVGAKPGTGASSLLVHSNNLN